MRYKTGMTDVQEHELLAVAHEAAQAGGVELLSRFGGPQQGVRAKSSPTDLVSDADLAAESAIRDVLARRRPGDAILAEEGGATGEGALRWIVDPLDGTINFLFGIPVFSVSIACEDSAGVLAGVVFDPIREECFEATRSGDAMLNGSAIRTPARSRLDQALVATGFAYEAALRARQATVVARVLPRVRDIRRLGSAALDLSWAALGRYDAYYERGLKRWDLAAGALIAERAGLELRQLPAGEDPAGLLAAPESFVDELLGLVEGA
jgi:myo-inositol-1(or 4)-monophosphatase